VVINTKKGLRGVEANINLPTWDFKPHRCFKVKSATVNLFLCLVKHHEMKTCQWVEEHAQTFWTSAPAWDKWSASLPGHFTYAEIGPDMSPSVYSVDKTTISFPCRESSPIYRPSYAGLLIKTDLNIFFMGYIYGHVIEYLQTGFGLVIGFIVLLHNSLPHFTNLNLLESSLAVAW
jgi:hypothetical protein